MHNNTWLSLANDCNSKLKKTIAFQKNDKPMILKNKSFPILDFVYMNGDFQPYHKFLLPSNSIIFATLSK